MQTGVDDMKACAGVILTDSEKYMEELLKLFERFSTLVKEAFCDDPRFLTGRDKVCVCVRACVCVRVCVRACVCACVCVCVCTHACMYTYVRVGVWCCMGVCMYMYVYVYVCMCVCLSLVSYRPLKLLSMTPLSSGWNWLPQRTGTHVHTYTRTYDRYHTQPPPGLVVQVQWLVIAGCTGHIEQGYGSQIAWYNDLGLKF